MTRQFADDRSRPIDDSRFDEAQQELLKQVLSATVESQRLRTTADDARYQQIADRWRGTPWLPETIGVSLVKAALRDWLSAVRLTEDARDRLVRDITQALFDDPIASAKFEKWWQGLQERKG